MKIARVCLGCGTPTRHGARCQACAALHQRATRNRVYDSIEWRRLRGRLLTAHVRRHGWVCPGIEDQHEPHPSHDLTLDHITPLSRGGELLDPRNLRVLCRSANSTRRYAAVTRGDVGAATGVDIHPNVAENIHRPSVRLSSLQVPPGFSRLGNSPRGDR